MKYTISSFISFRNTSINETKNVKLYRNQWCATQGLGVPAYRMGVYSDERADRETKKLPSFLSNAECVGIRKIHEGDRSCAGGDLINFPFCLVNLRRRSIFAPSIFYQMRHDACSWKSTADISFLFFYFETFLLFFYFEEVQSPHLYIINWSN